MKTLLLDKVYKPISFINEKKVIKFICTEKADVISEYKNKKIFGNINYPSIMILKSYIRKNIIIPRFHFRGVFLRDNYICQYTGEKLSPSQATIDHVLPKSRGGKSTWDNCVTASKDINYFKGSNLPEEVGLKLLRKPTIPQDQLRLEFSSFEYINPDWIVYFS